MFKTINRDQTCFLPTSMRDAIDENNLADIRLSELKVREQLVENAIDKLNADPNQHRINLTDLECREQKGIGFGYNVQIAVEAVFGQLKAQLGFRKFSLRAYRKSGVNLRYYVRHSTSRSCTSI